MEGCKGSALAKGLLGLFFATIFFAALVPVQPLFGASAKVYRVADMYPQGHPIYVGSIKWWIEEMDARTQGKFKAQWYGNSTLVPSPDTTKAVIDGTVQIGNTNYGSPMIPLQDVISLPNAFEDHQLVAAGKTYARMAQSGPIHDRYEQLGIKVLFAYATTNYQIFTTKKAITSLNDFKGLKIRTAGTILPKTISALGGVAVNMAMGEATDALQKGVVDGIALGIPSLKPYPFYDLIKNLNNGFSLGAFPCIYGMNMAAWKALPADIKAVMEQVNEATSVHAAEYYLQVLNSDLKEFQAHKMRIDNLSAADKKEIAAKVAPIWNEWVDSCEAKKLPGARVAKELKNGIREFTAAK